MGVRGLEKYISDRGDVFLQQFALCNCYLVVDGNSLACQLYALTKCDSVFGGDYDEYYKIVKDFFQKLQKCKVIPIIIYDGGHERKKIKTVLARSRRTLLNLHRFNQGYCTEKFFPLLLKNVVIDVMEELNVIYVQSELEADAEIAAIARALNCPVLSYDSDFYIFDVLYIPFKSVSLNPVRVKDNNFKGYYLPCLLYDIKNFLKEFVGLDKSMMPIAATLLGNDFGKNTFAQFFLHVIMSTNHNYSFNQRKIHGTFHWLKKENFGSAVQHILGHLGKKEGKIFLRDLNLNIKNYENCGVSPSVFSQLHKLVNNEKLNQIKEIKTKMKVPLYFRELFNKAKIHTFVLDMINLRIYFTLNQVEDIKVKSCHFWSLKLIAAIYAIIDKFAVGQSKPLSVYMINSNKYMQTFLEKPPFLNDINLDEIIVQSKHERLKLFYKILGFNESDLKTLSIFNDNWLLFMVSLIYWLKSLDRYISVYHARALILSAFCNQVVQKPVGYYRNLSVFKKEKGLIMKQLETTDLKYKNKEQNFFDSLKSVTMYECLLIQKKLIPMRQTPKYATANNRLEINAIHFFNSFQSCLYHISQLNILLGYPLVNIKISDFYSGTLTYNFYVELKQKKNIENFEEIFFKKTPNIFYFFEFLKVNLNDYFSKLPFKAYDKRKRKKPKFSLILGEDDITHTIENLKFYDDDKTDEEYYDEDNPYCILKT